MRAITVVVVSILLVSAPVAAQSFIELDDGTPVANESSVSTYEEDGVTSVTIERYSLTVTVSDDKDGAGVGDPFTTDVVNVFVRFEYEEDIPRTFRIYFPNEYWPPAPKKGLESIDGESRADLLPVRNRNYTSMTVHFDESGEAVFPVSVTSGYVFAGRDEGRSIVEDTFNVSLPSLGGDEEAWSYVEPASLSGSNTTVALPINGTATIQFKDGERWYRVPECSNDASSICRFTKDNSDQIHLLSLESNSHMVRYKQGEDLSAQVNAAIDDLMTVPSRLGEMIDAFVTEVLG